MLVALLPLLMCSYGSIIIYRKSINRNGPSFGYGFIMAWSFVMAFYCLLCGLVLDSFSTTALETNGNTGAYEACWLKVSNAIASVAWIGLLKPVVIAPPLQL